MIERPYLPPLKAHYERILYPLDIFEREEQKKMQLVKEEQEKEVKKEENGNTEQQKEYKPHNIPRLEMRKLSTFHDKSIDTFYRSLRCSYEIMSEKSNL